MYQYPINIIDFEASSLETDSYPIEVGVCVWTSPSARPIVWSSLIARNLDWLDSSWDQESESIHGISRRELLDAPPPHLVARKLNELLGGEAPVWCDGGQYDALWLRTLFQAAGQSPQFKIGDFWLPLRLNRQKANALADWLAIEPIPHRAAPDTLRLMRGIAFLTGVELGDHVIME